MSKVEWKVPCPDLIGGRVMKSREEVSAMLGLHRKGLESGADRGE